MRRNVRYAVLLAALATIAALAAGCGSSSNNKSSSGSKSGPGVNSSGSYDNGSSKKGGVYRVGYENSFGFTDNFDPTGEYLGDAWGILDNLLIRPLIGYKHVAGAAGNEMIGDLGTDVPQPTDNGLTYTYHLRKGVKFGPPVNRAITSKDVAYALERLADPKNGGQYAFYFTVVKGWNDYAAGKASSISGISTPNPQTLVVHLTEKTGDFNRRMSLPATAPIPEEVAKCFAGKPGDYGRDVVSSGPYMIQGANKVSASSCSTLKPMSGYAGANGQKLILVRNPNYDQSTDQYRKNYPNEFDFEIDSNADDIYNRVQAGQLEDEISSPQPKTIRQYVTDPNLKPRLLTNVGDRTWYLTMNLTQPPFDDVHVRKAMNYIIDKQALRQAWGGPVEGQIATHIVPPVLFGGGLSSYDPYATPNSTGSVAKAAAEMKKSKYDPGHTGKCTASACKGVLMVGDTRALDNRMIPVITADAKKIGITFTVRQINGAYTTIQTTNKNIPISERPGWGKDYADPYTFFALLFNGQAIIPSGNTNYSLVGITPQINQQKKLGVTGDLTNVPSIDPDIAACQKLLGDARTTCWENLDKKLMTQVVPWVPYLWSNVVKIVGPKVTHWGYDQFADTTAYSQVSVQS
ncbi:MAG TPA: ABC transporter substrate-binding protein [Gaiellaceae bacterium]|jgi:peptide/nickel transport system substrate-binding protein